MDETNSISVVELATLATVHNTMHHTVKMDVSNAVLVIHINMTNKSR